MSIFYLSQDLIFPSPELASDEGILAAGGDLSPARLVLAYSNGIFPWYSEGDPIIWWSPDPRFVLFPDNLRISESMKKILKKNIFKITFDKCFNEVIINCSKAKRKQRGTWITKDMTDAYCRLHELGFAHSAECWNEGNLVGGLYGVSLGRCFFGESMFSAMANSSKFALIKLVENLKKHDFLFIDSQVYTRHVESLGAVNIKRSEYLKLLKKGVEFETLKGDWGIIFN